jgi:hypothetical protein
MLVYVMNEINRQFRSDNYVVRNILITAFEFFPRLCILSLLRYWPFQLNQDQYLILRDTKHKLPLINKAVDFLLQKENWLDNMDDESDDSINDEIVCKELIDEKILPEENIVNEEIEFIEETKSNN